MKNIAVRFEEEYTRWFYRIIFSRKNGEHLGYFEPTDESSLCSRSFPSKDEAKKHCAETGLVDEALLRAL